MAKCPRFKKIDFWQEDFTGCDGKPFSDDFLKFHLDLAIKEERYERAAEIRDEITRREKRKKGNYLKPK